MIAETTQARKHEAIRAKRPKEDEGPASPAGH